MERMIGEVIKWDRRRGFGFLVGPDGCEIFMHAKSIASHAVPELGDLLTYTTQQSTRRPGEFEAVEGAIVKRANPKIVPPVAKVAQ